MQCLSEVAVTRRDGLTGAPGCRGADAGPRAMYSSSANSISTAAMFCSSCSRLDAPGIAATVGLRMAQASAICAGVAEWASATSRNFGSTRLCGKGSWPETRRSVDRTRLLVGYFPGTDLTKDRLPTGCRR